MAQSSSARLPYFEATWKNVVAPLINIIRLTLKCVPVAYTEILNKLRRPIQGQQKCVGLDSAGGSKKSFVVGLVSRDPALTEKEPERWHTWRAPARAYNRGLGVEPPVGSGGKAPGQGQSPLKLKAFWKADYKFLPYKMWRKSDDEHAPFLSRSSVFFYRSWIVELSHAVLCTRCY